MVLNQRLDRNTHRRTFRIISLIPLLLSFLILTGCVYLRLLSIKNQLAKFDDYFTIEVSDSFTLNFLEPKLYGRDIVYLSELQPSLKSPLESGAEWTFLFKKMISETEKAPGSDTDIAFTFRFDDKDLLTSLTFSPILLKMAPAEFLEMSLRSLGNAKIDKKQRQVNGEIKDLPKIKRALPKRDEILHYLGTPFSEEHIEDTVLMTFHYRLEGTNLPPEKEKQRLSITKLYFDPKTDELIRFYGRFAGMKISINYRKLVEEKFLSSKMVDS